MNWIPSNDTMIIFELNTFEGLPLYEILKNLEKQGYGEVMSKFHKEILDVAMQQVSMEIINKNLKEVFGDER